MSSTDLRTRCVLLAPRQGPARGIDDLLERQGWQALATDEPLSALAELCVLEAGRASETRWGRQAGVPPALVVVEPSRWPQLDEMLTAVQHYLPGVPVWTYADGRLQPTTAIAQPEIRDADQPPLPMEVEADPTVLGLTPGPPGAAGEPSPPQISAEELAMLLDAEPAS